MNIHVATVETMCPLVESLFDNDLVFSGATSDHSVSGCQIYSNWLVSFVGHVPRHGSCEFLISAFYPTNRDDDNMNQL